MKRLTDEERIDAYFFHESQEKCERAMERAILVMRARFSVLAPAKLGRPRKVKAKPPIAATEA